MAVIIFNRSETGFRADVSLHNRILYGITGDNSEPPDDKCAVSGKATFGRAHSHLARSCKLRAEPHEFATVAVCYYPRS